MLRIQRLAHGLVLLRLRLVLGSLLGQEDLMNVGEDTTASNGNITEKLVQLFVAADGQLEMTGRDGLLLVVSSSVASQLEDFSSQVLEDGCEVDGSTRTNALSIVALAEETMDTTDGELESGLVGTGRSFV